MKTKKERYEVIMAGSGGQGLVVSGIMLAEAAILEGKNVVQTVSYGIATRGGFSMAEVIIDKEDIIFQQVQNADIVLTMTEEAMEKFETLSGERALIVYDTTLMKERKGKHLFGYSFTDTASKMGNVGMANIIALGYMATVTGMVKTQSLAAVIKERFSGKVLEMNLKALQTGKELAAK
ncbi:MAG: 2-oxoacid:acceptor oxidoreductase family protein [Syntrophales bacterium]|nr:2-oxoacid:acceptor oxidoreductase family protein [Syntrophales bacterium]